MGYANSRYCLYNPRSRLIVTLQDVIFEEGIGHHPITILHNPTNEVVLGTTSDQTTTSTTPSVLHPQQPIVLRAHPGPLYRDVTTVPNPDTTNGPLTTSIKTANWSLPATQPLWRSTRLIRPTPTLIATHETLQQEQIAQDEGEDWAADNIPQQLYWLMDPTVTY